MSSTVKARMALVVITLEGDSIGVSSTASSIVSQAILGMFQEREPEPDEPEGKPDDEVEQ